MAFTPQPAGMFSLIITIISIALVAALALATLYYGGDAFRTSRAKVAAAKLTNQGQQLLAASELYYANRGHWPASIPVMVAEGYLSSVPVAQREMLQAAMADVAWQMPGDSQPLFVFDEVSVEVCRSVNETSYGLPGVLPKMQTGYVSQCYGPDPSDLQMVVGRSLQVQVAAINESPFVPENVSSDPIPAATDESAWTVSPEGEVTATAPAAPEEVGALVLEPADAGEFGPVATYTSVDKVVVVRNDSAVLVALDPPALAGHSDFSVNQTTCGPTLAPGASCDVTVRYAPTLVSGVQTSTLSMTASASAPLQGSAYNPVAMQSVALPQALRNQAYTPVAFSDYLSVSNETTPDLGLVTWEAQGALPAGMSFDSGLGILSGTPTGLTAPEGQDFTVLATYKSNQGQSTYTLQVGGVLLNATQISAGYAHTCALLTGGAVKCWGQNNFGQLGNNTTIGSTIPVAVSGLGSGVSALVGGSAHTCAVLTGGGAKCWGYNANGQVGDGTKVNKKTPVAVSGLAGVVSLSGGSYHTCAVVTGGAAKCWGYNAYGQLGDTTKVDKTSPVTVSGLTSGVLSISAGGYHSCAVAAGGAAKCWGSGTQGELGNGQLNIIEWPVAVTGLGSGVTSLTAGYNHTCAVVTGGAAKCWGYNARGSLGDGTTTNRSTPVAVSGLGAGVSSMAALTDHTCAVVAGAAKCWGYNRYGHLGDGTTTNRTTPTVVPGLESGVARMAAGGEHACALLASGAVKCWGRNQYGQLSDGSTTDRLAPADALE